ncbi:cytochrome P450 [Spirillospora sp. NPDC047279]|uniref:cytochrome P450 family protein n=1 Tax=Spirillospora sp. NPDC047279 TaxID=3155478 RepID=UPI0033DBF682
MTGPIDPPEIDLTDGEVVRDPFTAYGRARERAPLARLLMPGVTPWWVVARYEDARAMLGDPRFEINESSYMRPDVPDDCLPYMRTMSEMNGTEHARLRKLVSPAFNPRRAEEFRPRIEVIVGRLLDEVEEGAEDRVADLLPAFAKPLPMDVICELVGIPDADRTRWREYGATVAAGAGPEFAAAIPGIMAGAKAAITRRREEPADDLLADLIDAQAEDGDRLSDAEMVTLVWHLVMAGQTPTNLIANVVLTLLSRPGQLAALRADAGLMPRAVEELTRWTGSTLLTVPRYAREDAEIAGTRIRKGEAVTVSVAAANRDPRVFDDPERLDVTRSSGTPAHLGFGHGPHFCLGASLARVQTQVALAGLLSRFPGLALAAGADPEKLRAPDPGTWRVTALPVTLG